MPVEESNFFFLLLTLAATTDCFFGEVMALVVNSLAMPGARVVDLMQTAMPGSSMKLFIWVDVLPCA